jgi:uncharacterized protein (DUF885 family)
LNQQYLDEIRAIDPAQLAPADRISYDIFLYERLRAEESAIAFPYQLLPINQIGGLLNLMPALGSGTNAQPFATVQDYENWLKRLDGFVVWIDQAIVNMREGAHRGVVQPRAVVKKVLPQLEAMAVANATDSLVLRARAAVPCVVQRCGARATDPAFARALEEDLLPAYRRLRDFVRDEYLPQTRRASPGRRCPMAKAWYAYYVVEEHTTTRHDARRDPRDRPRRGGQRSSARWTRCGSRLGSRATCRRSLMFLETDPQFYFTSAPTSSTAYRAMKARINAALPKAVCGVSQGGLRGA